MGARGRSWRQGWAVGLLLFLATGLAAPATAQLNLDAPQGILTLNQDRLFNASQFGLRVQRELEAAGEALAAENRAIEAQLTEEELQLTQDRPNLPPEEFRALADEFDLRVGEIRAAQEAKAQSLTTQAEAARQRFFEQASPLLLRLVQDRGAAVLLDSRAVLLSAETVDITDAALDRINIEIGDGGAAPLIETGTVVVPTPRPNPDPSGDPVVTDP